MSKIDLKNAFRLIPVRPQDWNLLGIYWRQQFFVDTCLLFGLRCAPVAWAIMLYAAAAWAIVAVILLHGAVTWV